MKKARATLFVLIIFCLNNQVFSDSPNDPIWGLYASGVGERLRPGMDPCWVTYTVGLMSNPKIQRNVEQGLMGTILTNVNWYDASAAKRLYSRYFDDKPDGIYKLTPCEIKYPNLSGEWICKERCPAGGVGKKANISNSGLKLTITNEGGQTCNGKFESPNRIMSHPPEGNIGANISDDGKTIYWDNGTVWARP